MEGDQISLPYLIVVLVISGLIIHYLFFSTPNPGRSNRSRESALRAREAAVETIQQMFPQIDRRSILWDLQRNGGNVQATSERILAGRIETPPISFQPPPPPETSSQTRGGGPTQGPRIDLPKQEDKPSQPNLITRYNLAEKLHDSSVTDQAVNTGEGVEGTSRSRSTGGGWSSNREEREAILRRRRDEMILAARRKMEAKIATERAADAT